LPQGIRSKRAVRIPPRLEDVVAIEGVGALDSDVLGGEQTLPVGGGENALALVALGEAPQALVADVDQADGAAGDAGAERRRMQGPGAEEGLQAGHPRHRLATGETCHGGTTEVLRRGERVLGGTARQVHPHQRAAGAGRQVDEAGRRNEGAGAIADAGEVLDRRPLAGQLELLGNVQPRIGLEADRHLVHRFRETDRL
jgi:hypothetical protein